MAYLDCYQDWKTPGCHMACVSGHQVNSALVHLLEKREKTLALLWQKLKNQQEEEDCILPIGQDTVAK